ncbi:MAG: hypothetical protein RM022_013520 [Nostoc sp. EfeVER01]|uniref:hypothetical protein n=1 Tax=unclassified Nostoc TaxID=2593658 RepID=UPI00159F23E1|nr:MULTISPECIES: hypothetical protein [unclassified Nostoc]MDZ7947237.1 hypothetical protein [Nostoc sp. EfeVER01]MDZ7996090.1 hypothetical protein [Nostoc sp. EspVER01]
MLATGVAMSTTGYANATSQEYLVKTFITFFKLKYHLQENLSSSTMSGLIK